MQESEIKFVDDSEAKAWELFAAHRGGAEADRLLRLRRERSAKVEKVFVVFYGAECTGHKTEEEAYAEANRLAEQEHDLAFGPEASVLARPITVKAWNEYWETEPDMQIHIHSVFRNQRVER